MSCHISISAIATKPLYSPNEKILYMYLGVPNVDKTWNKLHKVNSHILGIKVFNLPTYIHTYVRQFFRVLDEL